MRLGLGHGLDVGYRPELFGNLALLQEFPGAAAAYALRNIDGNTATNVVRVRRSSDNVEADFTAAEITNGTLTTWTGANDGFVVTWYDQSGNAANITNATSLEQPKIVSSGSLILVNAKPVVRFDGSDDGLSVASFSMSTALTFSAVFLNNSGYLYKALFGHNYNNTSVNLGKVFFPRSAGAIGDFDTADMLLFGDGYGSGQNPRFIGEDTIADTNQHHIFGVLSSSNAIVSKNGSLVAAKSSGTGNINAESATLYIGRHISSGSNLQVDLQEFILYNSDQASIRTGMETAINSHYSIY